MSNLVIPPHSLEAEQSVIGGLLIQPYRIDDLPCSETDFYRRDHQVIFAAIVMMAEKNREIDIVTVAEYLESTRQLSDVGGIAYIGELAQNTPGAANIKIYAGIVREKALLRELIVVANDIAGRAATATEPAADIVAQAEAEIYAIAEKRETAEPVAISEAVREAVDHLSDVIDGVTYLSTGIEGLDTKLGGLQGGSVYVIAARPSMGKTALACSITRNLARSDKHIYFATLEMPRKQIAARLMAIDGNVNLANAKTWGDDEFNRLTKAAATVSELGITIDEESGLTLPKLRSRARRMKRRKGLDCIVVDYLQLMRQKADTREREIALLSAGMKSLAKELDVPILLLAQLNRDCDNRADSRPQLSDLRESGAIEQDADAIIMIYRDEVKNKDSAYVGVAELLIRKNRNGPTGDVMTSFQAEIMHFSNLSHGWIPPALVTPIRQTRGFK